MIVHYVISCFVKTIFYLFLLLVASVLGLKLWLEPVKGVCKCKTRLNGKVALVTGGNSGIGLETARDLAKRGARVVIACRNEEKSKQAVDDIIKSTGNENVEFKSLDLSKIQSIKRFADDFNKTVNRLDILVNNAGAAGVKEGLNEYGIDRVTQINYIGPFILTNLLLDKLIASKPSRIVIVSSYANKFHNFDVNDLAGKRKVNSWTRYCNTKLYNIFWAKALANRLPEGVTANSLHPGVVKTEIFNKLPEFSRKLILWLIDAIFKTAEEGAQTSIHLCVAPELENVSGEYFSDCKISVAAKVTNNKDLVNKVWDETKILVEKAHNRFEEKSEENNS